MERGRARYPRSHADVGFCNSRVKTMRTGAAMRLARCASIASESSTMWSVSPFAIGPCRTPSACCGRTSRLRSSQPASHVSRGSSGHVARYCVTASHSVSRRSSVGSHWFEYSMFMRGRYKPDALVWPIVSTHAHFARVEHRTCLKDSVCVIKSSRSTPGGAVAGGCTQQLRRVLLAQTGLSTQGEQRHGSRHL